MSTVFDTHGAKGLLLNHLQCSTDRPYLLLDAEEKITKCLDADDSKICVHERRSQYFSYYLQSLALCNNLILVCTYYNMCTMYCICIFI